MQVESLQYFYIIKEIYFEKKRENSLTENPKFEYISSIRNTNI